MDPISSTESLAYLMYEFGPAIVILSSFLMIFIVVIFYVLRQQQSTNSRLIKEHQQLLEHVISQRSNGNETKELVKIYTKVTTSINKLVMEYSNMVNPVRVAIYLLHNGSYGLTNFPFLKFSCVGESIRHSYFNRINNHVEYPVNLMTSFMSDLCNNTIIVKINDDSNEFFRDSIINKLVINTNNNYIVKSIPSSDSILVGFMLIEFDRDGLNEDTKDIIVKTTNNLANNISPIFEFSDFNEVYKESVES